MPIIIALISSLFFVPLSAHAKGWSAPSLSTEAPGRMLESGTSKFSVHTSIEQFSRRYSSDGEKVRLSRFAKNATPVTADVELENYNAKVRRTTVVPQWTNGIMPGWTIGAQLPIVILEYDKTYETEGTREKETVSRLGNVELMSKETLRETHSSRIVFLQRLQFPSAEYERTENEIQYTQHEENYVIGLGLAVEMMIRKNLGFELAAIYNYTLPDKIELKSTGQKISRDPGDETVLVSKLRYNLSRRISSDAGVLWGQKFEDKLSQDDEFETDTYSMQSVAETSLGYLWPQEDEFSLSYLTKVKYQKSLAGRNSEDLSALGVSLEMVF